MSSPLQLLHQQHAVTHQANVFRPHVTPSRCKANLHRHLISAVCASPGFELPDLDWEGSANNWVRAAETATKKEARSKNMDMSYRDWTMGLVDSASYGTKVARAIAQQTAAAELDVAAGVWRRTTVSWEIAEDSLREAANKGWTSASARSISAAARATAQGAAEAARRTDGLPPDPEYEKKAKAVEAVWTKAANIWGSAAEYIDGETRVDTSPLKPSRKGLSGATLEGGDNGRKLNGMIPNSGTSVTLYMIMAGECQEATLDRTWNPIAWAYLETRFKDYQDGTCDSKGFTEAVSSTTEAIPLVGDFAVRQFRRPVEGGRNEQAIQALPTGLTALLIFFFGLSAGGAVTFAAARSGSSSRRLHEALLQS